MLKTHPKCLCRLALALVLRIGPATTGSSSSSSSNYLKKGLSTATTGTGTGRSTTTTGKTPKQVHEELHYKSTIHKVINPLGWVKYKMNIIDRARDIYELCEGVYDLEFIPSLESDEGSERASLRTTAEEGKKKKKEVGRITIADTKQQQQQQQQEIQKNTSQFEMTTEKTLNTPNHMLPPDQQQMTNTLAILGLSPLPKKFEDWFNVNILHIWMVQKRLGVIHGKGGGSEGGEDHKHRMNLPSSLFTPNSNQDPSHESLIALEISQELVRHLWLDVEIKLHKAGIRGRIGGIVGDLVSSFQGQGLAYDEGLYYGDIIFSAALWRNLYTISRSLSAQQLVKTLSYVRFNLQNLEGVSNKDILEGNFQFSFPPECFPSVPLK